MDGEQLDAFVTAVREMPDVVVGDAHERELRRELADLPLGAALDALRAWRLLHPDRTHPTAGALRALWAEADLGAPSPREASDEITAVFRRERAMHDGAPRERGTRRGIEHRADGDLGRRGAAVVHGGSDEADRAALGHLRRHSPLLWRVAAEYGGPPPLRPDRWRDAWLATYDRVVQRELRARLLRNVPGRARSAAAPASAARRGDRPDLPPGAEIRVSRRLQPDPH